MRSFLFVLIFLCALSPLASQPLIDSAHAVNSERDVVYGSAIRFNGATDTLRMDVYTPRGVPDPRPLLLVIHGGAFMQGHRRDMAAWCERWAARGYVAITVSYRLGFYGPFPFDPPFAYDEAEVNRAAYRAVQDIRGALRFISANAQRWNIDTQRVVIGGASAGAIIAAHHAFIDPFDVPLDDALRLDDVVRGFDRFPRPDLGSVDGTLHTAYRAPSIDAVVMLYGAIAQRSYLDGAALPAVYAYHQSGDPTVSCNTARGLWGMPLGVGDHYPILYGSCVLREEFLRRSLRTDRWQVHIHEGLAHDVHDLPTIDREAAEFCARILSSPVSVDSEHDPTVASWVAFSLLGEMVAHGTGTLHDALNTVRDPSSAAERPPFTVLRFGQRLLWHVGNEVDHRR